MVTEISQFHVLTFVLATVLLMWWDTTKSTCKNIWNCLQYQGDSMAIMVGNMAAGRKALRCWSSWELYLQAAGTARVRGGGLTRCTFETSRLNPSSTPLPARLNTYSFLNNSPAGNPMFQSVSLWAFSFKPLCHLQVVAAGVLIQAIPAFFKW